MALTGGIPPAVKLAKKMKRLYLWGNALSGGFVPELCEMVEVEDHDEKPIDTFSEN